MCLSIPGKITAIDGNKAQVLIGEAVVTAAIDLIEDPAIGDYVLVHAGVAIQKIDEEDARETLRLVREIV